MANKTKATPKSKTKFKVTVKAKPRAPTKAVSKKVMQSKMPTKKLTIVKRITFTAKEFKEVQQMLTTNDCQTLKEWITKIISEHKLQQPLVST